MGRIHLVRHGRAAAGWDRDLDPPLDAVGRVQAGEVAARLVSLGPLPIVTSPLRRCQETAEPLAERWGATPVIEAAVAEVPSPVGVAVGDRVDWLRQAMAGTWSELGHRYTEFRDGVLRFVVTCPVDTVIYSHVIAINAVLGACLGDDRVIVRRLDNTSVTVVDTDGEHLHLVEAGREADTLIR
jgi:broad specificity phosphatase PhoE